MYTSFNKREPGTNMPRQYTEFYPVQLINAGRSRQREKRKQRGNKEETSRQRENKHKEETRN